MKVCADAYYYPTIKESFATDNRAERNRMPIEKVRPEDLLGPLNEVEHKNAPEWLFLAGDRSLLEMTRRVSIVGTREATGDGLRRAARLARELGS